jgi:hypothetical protein
LKVASIREKNRNRYSSSGAFFSRAMQHAGVARTADVKRASRRSDRWMQFPDGETTADRHLGLRLNVSAENARRTTTNGTLVVHYDIP